MTGDRILCGGADKMVTIWDSHLERVEGHIRGHKDVVTTVQSRVRNGLLDVIASGSHDGSIILWTNFSETTRKAWSLKLDKALYHCQKDYQYDKASRSEATRKRRKLLLNPVAADNNIAPAPPQTSGNDSDPHWIFGLDFDKRRLVCCSTAKVIAGWDFANKDDDILRCAASFPAISAVALPTLNLGSVAHPLLVDGARQGKTQQQSFRPSQTSSQVPTRSGRMSRKPNRLGFE
jgi:WD40 repeat protein